MKLLVSEAVKRSKGLLTAREIRRHCESGRLKATMYGGQWNIDEASFDKLMHEDRLPDLEMQAEFRRIAIEILEADNPDWREHNWDFDPASPDPFEGAFNPDGTYNPASPDGEYLLQQGLVYRDRR